MPFSADPEVIFGLEEYFKGMPERFRILLIRALELSVLFPSVLANPEEFSRHNYGTGNATDIRFSVLKVT
jgi:hypothetical protein